MSSADQSLKVIAAGPLRTGHGSLKIAFEKLLGGECYEMQAATEKPGHNEFWIAACEKDPSDDEYKNIFKDFTASVDYPVIPFYNRIKDVFPSCKVVLTVREPNAWYKSYADTIGKFLNPEKMKKSDMEMGHIVLAKSLGGVSINDKDAMIAHYHKQVEEVKKNVPADRLLVFNIADGWKPLCEFLGVPAPDGPFPHVNTTAEFVTEFENYTKL